MMQYRGRSARTITQLGWLILISVLLTVTLSAYAFVKVVEQLGTKARSEAVALMKVEDAVNTTSRELAYQTQEWKDLLLRSHDATLYVKHLKGFREHAAAVETSLQHAGVVVHAADISTAEVDALVAKHRTLMREYEGALARFDRRRPFSFRLADQSVRGMDRGLRDDLGKLSDDLARRVEQRLMILGTGQDDRAVTRHLYLLGTLTIALPLITLIATVLGYRALRRVSKGDARVRAIYDSIADAVVVTDMQGRVESINQRAQQLTGWTQEEARGRPLAEVFRVFDAASGVSVPSPVEIVLRDGRAIPMSNGMKLMRRDGSEVAIEDSASPVCDEKGGMFGVVMVFHDVSKRYALMEQLRQEQALFRQTFDLAAVGMAHLSINGKWMRVNRKLCEITGYSEAELLDLSFQGVTHPDDLSRDLEQLRALLANQIDRYHTEKRYVRKNGQILWVALTVSIVHKSDGTPDYGISIIEDIQARKEAEWSVNIAHEQYQALFDQMPEGVILLNENLGIEAFNQEALRQLGYDAAAMGGASPLGY